MSVSFSARVLEFAKRIPKGSVSTYGDIAKALKNPKAARSVGNALNKNPHPIYVPCHRIVRSDGCAGGYVFGAKKKIALLRSEGIGVMRGKITNFDKTRFNLIQFK